MYVPRCNLNLGVHSEGACHRTSDLDSDLLEFDEVFRVQLAHEGEQFLSTLNHAFFH